MRRPLAASALALVLTSPAMAQVATNITPDTAAGLATGTTITKAGVITTIDGGSRAGGNLFHSFTTFNLGAGEAAVWTATNPTAVTNVINRVTGGQLSTIAGIMDSRALPNADFYFINPAGVLFTTGARVAVPNAAYFSTGAGGLRFADGTTFAALLPAGTTFSSSAPESFGFLGNENGLVIDGVDAAFTPQTASLFLTAPNVGIRAQFFSPRSLDIVTTGGGAARVSLADPLGSAPFAGETLLVNSQIFAAVTGKGAPAIRIATGSFTQIGGILSAAAFFDGDAGDVTLAAVDADISGVVSSDTGRSNVSGDAGTVNFFVDSLSVHDGGIITSSTFGSGDGGQVNISAGQVVLEGDAVISSDVFGGNSTGNGGRILIDADRINVLDGAIISSSTSGVGNAGSINILADGLLVDRGIVDSVALAGSGAAGTINIQTRLLEARNDGSINSSSFSQGAAGTVNINADRILLRDGGNVTSAAFEGGRGGDVFITTTTDLVVATEGFISSDTRRSADAGSISIKTPSLTIRDGGLVSSSTRGSGRAGSVTVIAGSVLVTGEGQLRSQANREIPGDPVSTGNAGSVFVKADRLEVTDGGIVSSGSFAGDAGLVSVEAKDIVLEAGGIVSRVLPPAFGKAGQVQIKATNIRMDFGSLISSSTDSSGDAGGVVVTADSLTMDRFSNIESGSAQTATGDGGTVRVDVGTLTMRGTTSIITSTLSSGDAGQLIVNAQQATLESGSNLASRTELGSTGNAGSVTYSGDTLNLASGARITTGTAGAGSAGDVVANVGAVILASGGGLASSAETATSGRSGSVTLATNDLTLNAGGLIETNSANRNAAGNITVTSRGPVLIQGADAHISSENLSAAGGAAGTINLSGAPIRLAEGGFVSTNSVAGAAGDINLRIPGDNYLILEGRSVPAVITTSSGPGTGGRITLSNPLAVISNGGSILALGQARGANVQIQSDFFIRSADRVNLLSVDGNLVLDSQVSDVSAGVAIPDVSFLDASGVLRGQCPAARSGGVTSRLSLRPFGPYSDAPEPVGAAVATAGCR